MNMRSMNDGSTWCISPAPISSTHRFSVPARTRRIRETTNNVDDSYANSYPILSLATNNGSLPNTGLPYEWEIDMLSMAALAGP